MGATGILEHPPVQQRLSRALRAGIASVLDPRRELDASEDALAASWHKLIEAAHRGQLDNARERLVGYAYRVARNAALDDLRRLQLSRRLAPVIAARDTQRDLPDQGEYSDLHHAIATLPEAQRKAIELQLLGLSCQQIAMMLGTAIGTVKTWIHRGKARLRQQLAL